MLVLFILIIPLLISLAMDHGLFYDFGNGSDDGWLGFWGGYLGVIPSGLIAYYVARIQIDAEKKNYRDNHLIDLFLDDLREIPHNFENLNIVLSEQQMFDFKEKKCDKDQVQPEQVNKIVKNLHEVKKDQKVIGSIIERMPNVKDKKLRLKKQVTSLSEAVDRLSNYNVDKLKEKTSNVTSNYDVISIDDEGNERGAWKDFEPDLEEEKLDILEMIEQVGKNFYEFRSFIDNMIDYYSTIK